MAESIAPNSTEGSFRPNAAYAALIVSNADMMLPPGDALRSLMSRVMLAQAFPVLASIGASADPREQRFERGVQHPAAAGDDQHAAGLEANQCCGRDA